MAESDSTLGYRFAGSKFLKDFPTGHIKVPSLTDPVAETIMANFAEAMSNSQSDWDACLYLSPAEADPEAFVNDFNALLDCLLSLGMSLNINMSMVEDSIQRLSIEAGLKHKN